MKAFVGAACLATIVASGCQTSDVLSSLNRRGSSADQLARTSAGDGHVTGESSSAGLPAPSRQTATTKPTPTASVQVAQKLREGDDALRAGQISVARSHYEEVLGTQPENPAAHHGLAIVADREQRFGDAEKHYKTALKGDPHNADLIANLGYSYLLQGRYGESETQLRHALTKNPEHHSAVGNLGVVYARTGDQERARQMFARILPAEEVEQKLAELAPEKSGKRDSLLARFTGEEKQKPDATQELLRRMEEARQREQSQRQQDAPNQPRQMPVATSPTRPELADGRIPDSELNRVFSEIDRQGTPQNAEPIVLGPPAGARSDQPYQGQAVAPGHMTGGNPSGPGSDQTRWPGQTAAPEGQAPAVAQNGFGLNGFPNTSAQPEASAAASPWPASTAGMTPSAPANSGFNGNSGVLPAGGGLHQSFGQTPAGNGVNTATWQSGNPDPSNHAHHGRMSGSQSSGHSQATPVAGGNANDFEQAKREAAELGLGAGPGLLFPMMPQTTPRVSPGTASVWNGGMYPAPERQLPTMPQQPAGAVPASYAAPQERADVEAYRRGVPAGNGFSGQAPQPQSQSGMHRQQGTAHEAYSGTAISPGMPAQAPAGTNMNQMQSYQQQRQAMDDQYNSMIQQNLGGAHPTSQQNGGSRFGNSSPVPAPAFQWERPEDYRATAPQYGQSTEGSRSQEGMPANIPAGAIPLQTPPPANGAEQGFGHRQSPPANSGLVTPGPYAHSGITGNGTVSPGGHATGRPVQPRTDDHYEGPVIIPATRR
ncbi:cellulose synthase subunit BcsC [Maioricimonas rarisocia]|uniref:Cellulose synthase subunit BcsC n=2 Tax=Maioricimonas rarisocia TaxID=2528026 RepID=A0A517Z589_9PLAN|nr:cellulose synthase subunit BcsC [Maioricimonas rarisocia]